MFFIKSDIALNFAHNHANLSSSTKVKCDMVADDFKDGITNGAQWYTLCSGMQDFNYLSSNCFELTVELGCQKFPPGRDLAQYWKDNVNAFYEFMWQVILRKSYTHASKLYNLN